MEQNPVEDYTISLGRANLVSFLLFIPITLILGSLYHYWWGLSILFSTIKMISTLLDYLVIFSVIIAGIFFHEWIHGFTWIWLGKRSFHSIKYGFNVKALAPYAHCREPMEVGAYRWGAAMPGILLGVLPYIVSLVTGSGWLMFFGYLFTIMASGDALILWIIRDLEPGTMVKDHPDKAGCEIVRR